jgi:hypothetical protein
MEPETRAPLSQEEHRLRGIFEELRAKELAAEDLLANQGVSTLNPKYQLLHSTVTALRLKCDKVSLAIRALRKKMRNETG